MNRFLALCLVLLISATSVFAQDAKEKKQPRKRKPTIIIGRDTTFIDGPLDKDGYVDYRTALNKRLSEGVTFANNGNVLIWKALGPHPHNTTMPPEFWKWLDIPLLPEKWDYFISSSHFCRTLREQGLSEVAQTFDDALEKAKSKPWKAKDIPLIADWLTQNEKPLAVAVEATKRTHYFLPLMPMKSDKSEFLADTLNNSNMAGPVACRGLADALIARAMLKVIDDPGDAWQDLLACHRLGRLLARGGTLIEGLTGYALESAASDAALILVGSGKLDAKQLKTCLRDLQSLPPTPLMADKVGLFERFVFLDSVMYLDRSGDMTLLDAKRAVKQEDPALDYNATLRKGNLIYARASIAMRLKDRKLRERHLAELEQDVAAMRAKVTGGWNMSKSIAAGKDFRHGVSNVIGDILISLMFPAVTKIQHAADHSEQTQNNLHVAFALAAFSRDNGKYPNTLDALAPKYLPAVPLDLFSGKALIYRPAENGYLLYSVGVNGKDDGGRSHVDDPPGDDLSVRIGLPDSSKK